MWDSHTITSIESENIFQLLRHRINWNSRVIQMEDPNLCYCTWKKWKRTLISESELAANVNKIPPLIMEGVNYYTHVFLTCMLNKVAFNGIAHHMWYQNQMFFVFHFKIFLEIKYYKIEKKSTNCRRRRHLLHLLINNIKSLSTENIQTTVFILLQNLINFQT